MQAEISDLLIVIGPNFHELRHREVSVYVL